MATTASGLYYPGPGDPITPISTILQNMQNSVESALNIPLFATTTARDAQFAAKAFTLAAVGSTIDTATFYMRSNGAWYSVDPALFGQNAFTNYSPTVGASTTAPTSATVNVARWGAVGKLITLELEFTFGVAGANPVGVGTYSVPLPVNPASGWLVGANLASHGTGWFRDASVPTNYPLAPQVLSTTVVFRQLSTNPGTLLGSTSPVVPASTDYVTATVQYESA